jgi:hypothetical protein
MADEWYCFLRGATNGPMDFATLRSMVEGGRLKPGDRVRAGAHGQWVEAATVPGLLDGKPPAASAPAPPPNQSPQAVPRPAAVTDRPRAAWLIPACLAAAAVVPALLFGYLFGQTGMIPRAEGERLESEIHAAQAEVASAKDQFNAETGVAAKLRIDLESRDKDIAHLKAEVKTLKEEKNLPTWASAEAWKAKEVELDDTKAKAKTLAEKLAAAQKTVRGLRGERQQEIAASQRREEAHRWTGRGAKKTEVLNITTRDWAIIWGSSGDLFQVYVYDANGRLVDLAVNTTGSDKDTTYMHSGPGQFYLDINAFGGQWAVSIVELR